MESNFGRHLTLGVEEELMLLDPETLQLAPGVERLLGLPFGRKTEDPRERIPRRARPLKGLKTELFACLVETNTPVCETAFEVQAEVSRLRGVVREAAAGEGLAVAAAGMHPFSRPEEQEIVQEPRYVKMLAEMGPGARRQLVCGLHVHVGMESFETCLRTLREIRPWLPWLLALSLNSPFLEGEEAGMLSARADRLLELPRGGPPPDFGSVAEWEAGIDATGKDYTRSWWDARPHPRLGTLELRIADQPTSVDRTAALTALAQALCAAPPPAEPVGRDAYLDLRAAAAHGRPRGENLLPLVEPAAREFGTWELVQTLGGPVEALRQLDVGRRDGLEAVAAELVERTAA